jgi:hypothetical protein
MVRKNKKSSAGGALTIDGAAASAACVELPNVESSIAVDADCDVDAASVLVRGA